MELVKEKTKKEEKEEVVNKAYFISDTNLNLLKACVTSNSAALLVGETGTGKTTIVRELAREQGKQLVRISVNGSMGVEEILGKWLVEKGTTKWQDGVLTMALREGHWVVMDEINAALPEILFVLHSLLDDDRKIILPEKDNEIVKPHAEFRFFATMNPPEEYAGTKDMNKALLSRFTAVIQVDVLDEPTEVRLLIQKGTKERMALKLVKLARKMREYKKKDMIFYFCSTRDLVQCVQLMEGGLSLSDAIIGSVVNKMSQKEFDIVKRDFDAILAAEFSMPMSIDEMLRKIAQFDIEKAQMKAAFEIEKKELEKKIRESVGKEYSEQARQEILQRLAKLAKSN